MRWLVLLISLTVNAALADIGKITKVEDRNAYLLREGKKVSLRDGLPLKQRDVVHSIKNPVVLLLGPDTQFTLAAKTEMVVSLSGATVEVKVESGEAEFSSPHVHTFVPEIVKGGEGFTFSRETKKYSRRKLK